MYIRIGRRKSLSLRRRPDRIARGSLRVRCVRSKCLFIVSHNEVVIILFPRGGANTGWRGGPIIPVIILIGALTSTIIISVEIQHTTRERRKEREKMEGKRERARASRRAISTPFRQCYPFGTFNVRGFLARVSERREKLCPERFRGTRRSKLAEE